MHFQEPNLTCHVAFQDKSGINKGGGVYLNSNLITRYLAFEGQTSQFDAYVLRMR